MSESTPELSAKQDEMEKQSEALLQMVLAAKREIEDGHGISLAEAQRLLSEH